MTTDVIIPTLKSLDEVTELTQEIQRTAGCPVRVIPTCLRMSASINRNRGLNVATSDLIAMVDDDIREFPQNWLVDLCKVMNDLDGCVMVSARLINPDGSPACMVGNPKRVASGVEAMKRREVITACCVVRNDGTRFDEAYKGSGWEDKDFCRQLAREYPEGEFVCHHDVRVVHLNEAKNQGLTTPRTEPWITNERYYTMKWANKT